MEKQQATALRDRIKAEMGERGVKPRLSSDAQNYEGKRDYYVTAVWWGQRMNWFAESDYEHDKPGMVS